MYCQKCLRPFCNEDPAYEVQFGFVWVESRKERPPLGFWEDSYIGLFHGPCLNLPERQNDEVPACGK